MKLELAPHTVLRYESGAITPSDQVVERISRVLFFPARFFFGHDVEEVTSEAASFRSLTAMSAAERDAALAAGSMAYLISDWVEERFNLPPAALLDVRDEAPETAARSLREEWALGEQPVGNMVHLLESKGVRVFSIAENTRTVDAFSVWRNRKPYVFLNTFKSGEHGRFDAAHELGHLVLHRHGGPTGRKAEEEAHAFASSFLMPAADVLAVLPRVHGLNQIVELKKRWSVSAMALIHRLRSLEIISDWQYRMFCIQATELTYRTNEPFPMRRETSAAWQQVLGALWQEGKTKADIANDLDLHPSEVEELLFGLTGSLEEPRRTPQDGPWLKLV